VAFSFHHDRHDVEGITVRPIQTIDGAMRSTEGFSTTSRLPVENLVGEENKGGIKPNSVGNERPGIARVGVSGSASPHQGDGLEGGVRRQPVIEDQKFAKASPRSRSS